MRSIWLTISKKHEELLQERPAEQGLDSDSATGWHFGLKCLVKAAEKGECRNVSASLV